MWLTTTVRFKVPYLVAFLIAINSSVDKLKFNSFTTTFKTLVRVGGS